MSYSTIYDIATARVLTDGVQSQAVCNATINTARNIARDQRRSVIVEDRGTGECYRVTPAGHRWKAPSWWQVENDQ
jgi:streptogramin lyase